MAGLLPGVEVARRRRVHQSNGWYDSNSPTSLPGYRSTRRPCLNSMNHKSHLTTAPSSMQRSSTSQTYQGEKLVEAAREAKERLDEKLKSKWKSDSNRVMNGQSRSRGMEEGSSRGAGELHKEGIGTKKSGLKWFSFTKLGGWKALEQEECAVCLEQFKAGENLMHLPCAHRFHSRCLVPWLENNAHCPCCRLVVEFDKS